MSLAARLMRPLARDYLAHAGLPLGERELRARLEQRLRPASRPARCLTAAGALFMRWLAPLLFLGRWRSFGGLDPDGREELLGRLQRCESAPVKGLFLGVRPLLLCLCYGRGEFFKRFDERP